ncbi:hypothetical protein BOTCAL_0406g00040 [Botryotinia calthae]|uniref:Uncharacterized protein n=1 Tax=Botryotinia calthae TaxID=38488 RepID=A0A4Y8CPX0_9HELO|nr:hypothetical protein BOTCAL_0406g00040 [Botryotinia calthae]
MSKLSIQYLIIELPSSPYESLSLETDRTAEYSQLTSGLFYTLYDIKKSSVPTRVWGHVETCSKMKDVVILRGHIVIILSKCIFPNDIYNSQNE